MQEQPYLYGDTNAMQPTHENDDPRDMTEAPDTELSFQDRVKKDTKMVVRYQDVMGPQSARTVVKALFTKIIEDLGITQTTWKRLMDSYLKDPLNHIPNNREAYVQERSALTKNFVSNDFMTWVMLCRALRFIRIKRFKISLTMVHSNNSTTEHGMWVNLRNKYPELDNHETNPINRIPTIEMRGANTPGDAAQPGQQQYSDKIHVPPAIDLSAYSRNYPKAGEPAQDERDLP